jgi:aspartate kinase
MVSEAVEEDGRMQLQLTIDEEAVEAGERITNAVMDRMGGGVLELQRSLSRIVLVGSGMHQRPGVYARAFRALLDEGIDIFAVSTSGITITVLVQGDREEDAVRVLHDAFTLDLVDGTAVKA